jgi:hypothetical protein
VFKSPEKDWAVFASMTVRASKRADKILFMADLLFCLYLYSTKPLSLGSRVTKEFSRRCDKELCGKTGFQNYCDKKAPIRG